jgi:DNA-binding CsgD family transcriptional regulator
MSAGFRKIEVKSALQYLKVISKFYEAAANPDIWPEALQAVADATGSRGALLTTPVFIPGGLAHSAELKEAVHQFFDEAWYMRDERTSFVRNHHFRNGFFTDHTLFTDSQMDRSEYYEKFARKADVPWFAAGRLKGDLAADAVSISLQRSSAQGYFTQEEVAVLNQLLPHLEPSMMLASRIAEAKGRALMDGLQLARQPAVLLKPDGLVTFANARAEQILGQRLFIRQKRLICATSSVDTKLQTLILQACKAVSSNLDYERPLYPVTLPSSETESRLVITAAPIRRSGADVVAFSGVIVMISDTTFGVHIPEEMLQLVFDLTLREASVMARIGRGQNLRQIGEQLGIGLETVRHHLKSVFVKTGTGQQSELVSVCAKLHPVVGI